ncbi:MAG: serine hydrolase domain-containing protein [Bacteroidota bacterium]
MSIPKLSAHYFFLFFLFACSTQETASLKPELAVLNASYDNTKGAVEQTSFGKVDQLFDSYIAKKNIPGAAVLIASKGKVVYKAAAGWQDVATKSPLAIDHIFRIASMTKPITSVAILQLYEKGSLKLTDPVSKYIPEFKSPKILTSFDQATGTWKSQPAQSEITIHQLLTHTSGIGYGFESKTLKSIYTKHKIPDLPTHLPFLLADKMSELGQLPILHEPGKAWSYGLSHDVLGRVVEVVSGQPLDQYFEESIFKPLGMSSTGFFLDAQSAKRLVKPYHIQRQQLAPLPDLPNDLYAPDYPVNGAKRYFSGGSGLCSTVEDYFQFCQALLNGGELNGKRILKPATVALMTSNQIGAINPKYGEKYGYGVKVTVRKNNNALNQLPGRYGWSGAFHTTFWVDPEREAIAIMMSQVLWNPHDREINRNFERLVNEALTQ